MRRARLAVVAAAAVAAAVGVAASSGPGHRAPHTHPAKRAAPSIRRSPARYYATTVAHGAPIAVLHRPVELVAAPNEHARRIARLAQRTEWRSPRVLAVVGRRGGWLRVIATQLPNGHRAWIRLSAVTLVADPWRIEVSLSKRRVTVLRRGRVVRRIRVAVGLPGTPTPATEFAVTDKLALQGDNPAYGCCALALSGHQPNVAQGWTGGDRLAIHGTTELGTIGTAASHGCLRASDEDVRWLVNHVYLGTLVEIRR